MTPQELNKLPKPYNLRLRLGKCELFFNDTYVGNLFMKKDKAQEIIDLLNQAFKLGYMRSTIDLRQKENEYLQD